VAWAVEFLALILWPSLAALDLCRVTITCVPNWLLVPWKVYWYKSDKISLLLAAPAAPHHYRPLPIGRRSRPAKIPETGD